ncbi:S-layer homology domain-containing protein [Paenibacillus sp. HWE-109]|uniref:S-layer homology domain-containing protein n=1 Tax=Paenibacillus sp. HWE-109 TaxID=1306526 RepID=UPI001EDFBA1C|nr:S-layer homology domain-containing protein [Paenibacillus sp. HWE-109]UKS23997.1 S-layer homology domain-containing protein [Paenibacillus sp. HWE-109]
MKKKVILFVCSVICAGSLGYDAYNSLAQGADSLRDISGHWSEQAIRDAVKSGYVDGYADGNFKPDSSISRAEFMKMIAAATGEKVNKQEGEGWYKPYTDRLKEKGVIPDIFPEGYSEPLQRYEMAMLSVRSTDIALKGTMQEATSLGLIHGISTTDLAPYGTSTRAQAITVIERILAVKRGEQLPVDKYAASKAEIDATGSNVGTMLGLKPKEIGTVWNYGEGVTVKLNQLIIADPSDADDPYMKLVDMSTWGKSTSKTGNKVIFANFTVNATQASVGTPDLIPQQMLVQLDASRHLLLSEQQLTRWMRFNTVQINEGFIAYAIPNRISNDSIVFDILGKHVILAGK